MMAEQDGWNGPWICDSAVGTHSLLTLVLAARSRSNLIPKPKHTLAASEARHHEWCRTPTEVQGDSAQYEAGGAREPKPKVGISCHRQKRDLVTVRYVEQRIRRFSPTCTPEASVTSIAPRPLLFATSIVPQTSNVLPLVIVMVLAPIDPEAMTDALCPLEIASTAAWTAAR